MSDGIMIMKLRPTYDTSFPPGYLQHKLTGQNPYPPDDFNGRAWLTSLTRNEIMADIHRLIYRHASQFSDSEIWYFACFPHVRELTVDRIGTYTILRSALQYARTESVLVIFEGQYGAWRGIVERVGNFVFTNTEETASTVLSWIHMHAMDYVGKLSDYDYWLHYYAPKWFRNLADHGEHGLPHNTLARIIP